MFVLDGFAAVAGWVAPALSPIWRAWNWLTGRSTFALARLMWVVSLVLYVAFGLREGDWVWARALIVGIAYPSVLKSVLVLERHADDVSDVLSVEVILERRMVAQIAGLGLPWVAFYLVSFPFYSDYLKLGHNAAFVLALFAALAAQPGSGRSVVRRAVASVRSALAVPQLAPLPFHSVQAAAS